MACEFLIRLHYLFPANFHYIPFCKTIYPRVLYISLHSFIDSVRVQI